MLILQLCIFSHFSYKNIILVSTSIWVYRAEKLTCCQLLTVSNLSNYTFKYVERPSVLLSLYFTQKVGANKTHQLTLALIPGRHSLFRVISIPAGSLSAPRLSCSITVDKRSCFSLMDPDVAHIKTQSDDLSTPMRSTE